MNVRNEWLVSSIERDVLKEILGTKDEKKALAILNSLKDDKLTKTRSSLIEASKRRKLQILHGDYGTEGMHVKYATDFLGVVADTFGVEEVNYDALAHSLTLNDVSYALSFFKNVQKQVYIYHIKKRDTEEPPEFLKKFDKATFLKHIENLSKNVAYVNALAAVSEYGAPASFKSVQPRIIKIEDDEHVFVTFECLSDEKIVYDALEREYKTYHTPQEVICRLHLREGMLEIQQINADHHMLDACFNYLSALFSNEPIIFSKMSVITEQYFRAIDTKFVKRTHSKHEGVHAIATLTRANVKADTRADTDAYSIINPRPIRELNGLMPIPKFKTPVMVEIKKTGAITIKTEKLTPKQRHSVVKTLRARLWP